jgi:integrase
MSRNANGEGSIWKRMRDGRHTGYIGAIPYTGDDGKTKRHVVYGRTRADVREKLNQARDRLSAGAPVRDATRSVGDWLAHWRVTSLVVSDRKESTQALYANLSRCHLEPAPFGAIPLNKLKPSDVEALVLSMRAKTKPDGTRALSDSTIRTTYTVLRASLDGAMRDSLIARNPAAVVKRPGVERQEGKHLNDADLTAVLKAAQESRYHPVLVLIAATGLRKGEALALRWDKVDLDAGMVRVAATIMRINGRLVVSEPKTDRARRVVPLAPAVVAMLRRYRTTQKEDRMRAGDQWTDSGLVFTTELGSPVDPRNLLRVMESAAKTAGVEGVGVHTLRHSAAVGWLEAGVHIKAVADLLGHSTVAVTGDVYVYGHTSGDTARAAVDGRAGKLGL